MNLPTRKTHPLILALRSPVLRSVIEMELSQLQGRLETPEAFMPQAVEDAKSDIELLSAQADLQKQVDELKEHLQKERGEYQGEDYQPCNSPAQVELAGKHGWEFNTKVPGAWYHPIKKLWCHLLQVPVLEIERDEAHKTILAQSLVIRRYESIGKKLLGIFKHPKKSVTYLEMDELENILNENHHQKTD